jgi:uncharacterized protein YkwD
MARGVRGHLLGGVLFAALVATSVAAPAAPSAATDACSGVNLVADDGHVICQPVSRRSPMAKRGCQNSQVPGYKLRPKLAAAAIHCLFDKIRGGHGLRHLSPQNNLKKAAKRHTDQMLSIGCFAHQCPGEPDLVGRVTAAGYLPCTCNWSVGENLAWGIGWRATPAAIVDAWMASPPHREMILMGAMRDVDVGVKTGAPGSGTSKAATYTADFGVKN